MKILHLFSIFMDGTFDIFIKLNFLGVTDINEYI